ncbi:dihydrofolate reductase family protein [Streptomyces sp. NRRL WC-3742]|uniref:dihydrofolate reductase family protein n=1 Tax=Streptomyces sp. NRRL WC-3742 TaxID=1463934 RepID=UPI0004C7D14F|nr:dihydrofolate reductase family protein [Streptomyces sp. NRRL WC-3742]
MRIVTNQFISLDGVVQAPGGPQEDTDGGFAHGGWSHPYFDADTIGPFLAETMSTTDALLFGRRTWQTMAAAWPERAGDPFADQMNSIKKYVVSDTLTEADLTWTNTTLVPGPEAASWARRRREADGGDLLIMGSPTLVRSLLTEDLVDELRLIVMPVVLGGGKTIFPTDGVQRAFELVSTTTAKTGTHVTTYRRATA